MECFEQHLVLNNHCFSYIYATVKVWRAFIHTKASSIFETASFDSWEDSACVLAVTKSLKPCNV